MQDLVYLILLVGFFVLAWLFAVACDRIIGSDDEALAEGARGEPEPEPYADSERMAA